jgi:hypothetical protein
VSLWRRLSDKRSAIAAETIFARVDRIEKLQRSQRELLKEIRHEVARLEKMLDARMTAGRVIRIEQNVQALARLATLDPATLPFPQRLTAHRFRLRSQNGEDGVTLALLREVGSTVGRFVELGCGDNGGNTGFLAEELGWSGLMVDGDDAKLATLRATVSPERVDVVQAWITAETVNDLIAAHGLEGEIDVLSIDIDGNDYWLWKQIDVVSPRIVIVEYNSMFGADRAVVVPYDPEFRRRGVPGLKGTYYGASLQAHTMLGRSLGYRLVAVEARGANAYFLRDDVAPHVPAADPRAEYRMLDKYAALAQTGFDVWRLIEEQELPLVDVREPVSS